MWQTVVGAALAALLSMTAALQAGPPASAASILYSQRAGAILGGEQNGPGPAPLSSAPAPSADANPPTLSSAGKRFWVKDKHRYTSPWYAGARRKMINFGCTRAPYYDPDPRCARHRGFHHGLDIAMPCGTRLFAGFRGWVVDPSSAGSLGSAYGARAFRIRSHHLAVDVVIGHVRRVYVGPGDRVRTGRLIARASDAGAPDGCHLHFEVRPRGAGYQSAVRPHDFLRLTR